MSSRGKHTSRSRRRARGCNAPCTCARMQYHPSPLKKCHRHCHLHSHVLALLRKVMVPGRVEPAVEALVDLHRSGMLHTYRTRSASVVHTTPGNRLP